MSLIVRYAIIGHYNNEANLLSLSISHNLIVHEIFQIFYLLYYEIWIYKIVFIICVTVSIYHCWCMNTDMCEIIHHQLESWSTSIWHHIYHLFLRILADDDMRVCIMNKHLSVQEFVHENCMAVYVVGRRGYHGGGVQLMGVFTVWCAVVFQMKTLIMCMRLIGSYNLE